MGYAEDGADEDFGPCSSLSAPENPSDRYIGYGVEDGFDRSLSEVDIIPEIYSP